MEPLSHQIWIGFAGGLLGFAHCLGMCGGFVLHLSQGHNDKRFPLAPLLWLSGKFFSYLFLGALAGCAGRLLGALLFNLVPLQNLLSYLAGAVIFFAGLTLLGLLPVRNGTVAGSATGLMVSWLGDVFLSSAPGSALALGLASGFLPCPIVLAFLAYAFQSGSVATGMATMGALALGTAVPLLLLGGASRLSGLQLRRWAPKAGGIILIALGIITALRGTTILHHPLGCPPQPSLHLVAADAEKPPCTGEHHGNGSGN